MISTRNPFCFILTLNRHHLRELVKKTTHPCMLATSMLVSYIRKPLAKEHLMPPKRGQPRAR